MTTPSKPKDDAVERVARALWFDFVDQQGYPNGLPTWDDMSAWPASDRNNRCEEYRSLARAAIAALSIKDDEVTEGMTRAGIDAFAASNFTYWGDALPAIYLAMRRAMRGSVLGENCRG